MLSIFSNFLKCDRFFFILLKKVVTFVKKKTKKYFIVACVVFAPPRRFKRVLLSIRTLRRTRRYNNTRLPRDTIGKGIRTGNYLTARRRSGTGSAETSSHREAITTPNTCCIGFARRSLGKRPGDVDAN